MKYLLRIIILITIFFIVHFRIFAQALVNNFAKIYIKQGAQVYVKTNSVSNNDLIDNAGELTIELDFINNDTATGGGAQGIYYVQRDWINNGVFIADQSEVRLYGADQLISGSAVTAFYDLTLTGSGIKRQTINSETMHTLALNDRELATDDFEMLVSNTDVAAITRSTGFVSSINTGRLSRKTDAASAYLFPTGSSDGTLRYRPVSIKPASPAPNTYGVRLANVDATTEAFDRSIKEDEICEVNPLWYHRIYRSAGNDPADVEIFYEPSSDGDWQDIGHWQTFPHWERTNAIASANAPFSTYIASGWNDFSYSPFALVRLKPSINAGNDTTIIRGTSLQLNPTVTGTFNTFLWSPDIYLDNPLVLNPIATPDSTITYTLTIDNGTLCKADDNITLIVVMKPTEIAIPQAFSPNGDGVNDFFMIMNPEVIEEIHFKIFNRWGELVFQTTDKNFRWDGTYKGSEQNLGVFAWVAQVRKVGNISNEVISGNVTLVK
ncbi:MAG: hypothetical protein KatS3mg031_3014 [Chitinophagales bacterium]|nr:MAG: hypothetical protein KatS3mg031_3014 [Chitinophagales bacterium]